MCPDQPGDVGSRGRVFLTGWDRVTPDRIGWMFEMLAVGDPDGEVGAGILAKELLSEVYVAVDTARASNGRVENIHMLAEKTRRCAHGFTNQHNYRRRLIGRYGIKRDTVPTRRIRGRQPHPTA